MLTLACGDLKWRWTNKEEIEFWNLEKHVTGEEKEKGKEESFNDTQK